MRDEIMRLAERAADMLDGFEQALRRYAPIEDVEEWPYHPEITDTAAELRALARTDHVEDKLGMVAAPYAMTRNDAGEYVDRLGWKHSDQFAEGWNACREATLAASPAPDHSAGAGGMVIDDAMVERLAKHLCREEWKNRCPTIEQLTAQMKHARRYHDEARAMLTAALAQPADADAEGGK